MNLFSKQKQTQWARREAILKLKGSFESDVTLAAREEPPTHKRPTCGVCSVPWVPEPAPGPRLQRRVGQRESLCCPRGAHSLEERARRLLSGGSFSLQPPALPPYTLCPARCCTRRNQSAPGRPALCTGLPCFV